MFFFVSNLYVIKETIGTIIKLTSMAIAPATTAFARFSFSPEDRVTVKKFHPANL